MTRLAPFVVLVAAMAAAPARADYIAYRDAVLADAPVGYWSMNEAVGPSATDLSGFGNTGAYQNSPLLGNPGAMAGSTAPQFNGVTQSVRMADPGVSSLDVSALTMEAWVNWNGATGENIILNKENSYEMAINGGIFQIAVWSVSGSPWFYYGTAAVTANRWTHLAASYDPGAQTLALYVDGSLVDSMVSAAMVGPVLGNNQPLYLGRRSFGNYMHGLIDEAAVYDGVLSGDRIAAHFDAAGASPGSVPEPTGLALLLAGLAGLGYARRRVR